MVFVVDKGILKLRTQIDEKAPGRSKASDGTLGDPAHQARTSDHNPQRTRDSSDGNDPDFQVDAGDFTHDPAHGADMHEISEAIRLSKDRRVQYVIFDGRIFSGAGGNRPWVWRDYDGDDDHSNHMHVSVVDAPNDYTADWDIGDDMDLNTLLKSPAFPYTNPSQSLGTTWLSTFNDVKAVRAEQAAAKLRDEAILAALAVGGGNVDSAAILARMDQVRVEVLAKLDAEITDLTNEVHALRTERDELLGRLANAIDQA